MVGYDTYVELVQDLLDGKEVISTGMTREVDRCRAALDAVKQGRTVALISIGDAGVYGMAGLAIELAAEMEVTAPIEIVPGVTAASSAAARLGAPLMLDFAVVSLSDLLVPWETIKKRLAAAAEGDFVTALYNPKSKKRVNQFTEALDIFRARRSADTPVGICDAVGIEGERITLTTLGAVDPALVGMRTTVIIGSSASRVIGKWFVTPRGYEL